MTPYSQDLRQRIVDTVQRGDGTIAPDRRAVPGQRLLRHPAVAAPPHHRLGRTQAPRRRQPGRAHARGPRAAPRADPRAARCHARGVPPAPRLLVQPRDHLPRPQPAGAAAQEEGPARRGAGQPGGPGATTGVLRGARRHRPAAAGLRGRVRGQHGDDPDLRPCPRGAAGLHGHPRPLGVDHADLRDAALRA